MLIRISLLAARQCASCFPIILSKCALILSRVYQSCLGLCHATGK